MRGSVAIIALMPSGGWMQVHSQIFDIQTSCYYFYNLFIPENHLDIYVGHKYMYLIHVCMYVSQLYMYVSHVYMYLGMTIGNIVCREEEEGGRQDEQRAEAQVAG